MNWVNLSSSSQSPLTSAKPFSIPSAFVMGSWHIFQSPAVTYLEMPDWSHKLVSWPIYVPFLPLSFLLPFTAILYLYFSFYIAIFSKGSSMYALPSQSLSHSLVIIWNLISFSLLNCLFRLNGPQRQDLYPEHSAHSRCSIDICQINNSIFTYLFHLSFSHMRKLIFTHWHEL